MSDKKIALITGSARGIGKAIARALFENNWQVITHSKSTDSPEFSTLHIKADLISEAERDNLIAQVLQKTKRLDLLVHNAGFFVPSLVAKPETTQILYELLQVHIVAVQHLTSRLLHIMPKGSNIVIISSIAGLKPYLPGSAYSVAKAGERMLGLCLREELKERQIGVHVINPGPVLTDSWQDVSLPEERFSSPEDIAKIVKLITELSPRTIVDEITINPMLGPIE